MNPQETDVAGTLERGLAPDALPRVAGLTFAGRYRSSGAGRVGGDWYDVLEIPGGAVSVVVGDVAGHGVDAATIMSQLRYGAKAYLLDDPRPSSVLRRLNRLALWAMKGEVATCVVALFSAAHDQFQIAAAGHVPPLLLAGATATYTEIDRGPALGLSEDSTFDDTVHRLAAGASLLLFTDGLVERRGESIDAGLQRLAEAAAQAATDSAAGLLDHLVAMIPADSDDDLALVSVRRDHDV